MIDRLLENWMNRSSERSYQLTFCHLLQHRGETVFHLTRHCGMELGKDILSKDPDGNFCAYQLKGVNGGRLSLKDWQETVQHQVHLMVHTPIIHPSVPAGTMHRSFLVINGDVVEEVLAAINAKNAQYDAVGTPQHKLTLILKGDLLKMLRDLQQDFLPSEIPDFQSLLSFYQHDGQSFLNKAEFWTLLNSVLPTEKLALSAFKRAVSSCSILCSLSLSSYTQQNNHLAVAEGWMLFISSILRFAELQDKKFTDIKLVIELSDKIILSALSTLWTEVNSTPQLLDQTGPGDLHIYPYRLTMIMGLMAYLAMRTSPKKNAEVDQQEILSFILKHSSQSHVWGESALPFVLSTYWFLKQQNATGAASDLLSNTLGKWTARYGLPGSFFANVYHSADDALSMEQDLSVSEEQWQEHVGTEYTLETVVHLCAKNGLKESLIQHWPDIGEQLYRDFEYERMEDYYLWFARGGKDVSRAEKTGHKWAALVYEACQFNEDHLPLLLKKNQYLVPLFLMVYPHRTRRNMVIWYDNLMTSMHKK